MSHLAIKDHDALLIVDVQNDFLDSGALPVPEGSKVIPELNKWIKKVSAKGLPIFATRDWHPKNHTSFKDYGGIWPPHCIQGSHGAEFPNTLALPKSAIIISKGTDPNKDAYSGFDGTDLRALLRKMSINRLFIGGLATDYCVKATVIDALELGFEVVVIRSAIRGVDVNPGDTQKALKEMEENGAKFI